jgi:DNA repair protein RadD
MTGLLFSSPGALRALRPHQERALDALRASLAAGKRRPMLMAPTGAGKTLLAAHIIKRALDKGKRVAFTVPRLSLVDQSVASFEAEGIRCVGVMQGIHERTDRDQPVQVCSIQTIARRRRPEVDLVIVDEAHELHKEIFRWMADCPVPFIGLSATPWSRGLGKYYDDLIISATTEYLISQDYLSKFSVFAPSEPDLSAVSTRAGEFAQDELADAMDKASITGDIVSEWQKRGENRPTIAFCVNRKHAQHVCERFIEVGVAAEYADCDTVREDREAMFGRFRSGATKVLCNVGILTTGLDLPMVSCLVDAQPTKSRILFTQKVGRGLRTAPGKDRLIVIDHAGNHLRLGMVTDIGQTHLDDGKQREGSAKKERSEPLPKLCPECKAVLRPRARECSECGAPIVATSMVREAEGELVELGSRRSGARESEVWEKRRFFSELQSLRKPHYSDRWSDAMFKQRFGHWPNGYDRSVAMEPSLATRNWVRSRQIAYAKGRAAHG